MDENNSVKVPEPMLAAGPGAVPNQGESPKPMLEGASEYEYVEIHNPLSVDFIGQFAVDRPVQAPIRISSNPQAPGITASESDLKSNYGLDLRNPLHQGKASIINTVTIPAGKTIRILGSAAQVVVRQLVTEILQREGKRLMLADPWMRHSVEQRVVMSRGTVEQLLGRSPVSIQQQLQEAVNAPLSPEVTQGSPNEPEFPEARPSKAQTSPAKSA